MHAICDSSTGAILFCQQDAGDQPEGRVAVELTETVAEYALMGFPLVRTGTGPVTVDLAHAKSQRKALVKQLRDDTERAGCTVAGVGTFETDDASKLKINGAVSLAMVLGESFSIDWRMSDNTVVTLNAAQMISVGVAVGMRVSACQLRKNALDAEIAAAATIEELAAVDINSGWPA